MFNIKLPQYIGKKIPLRFDVGKPPNDYNAKVLAQLLKGSWGRFTLYFQGFVEGVAYNWEEAPLFCIAVTLLRPLSLRQMRANAQIRI
jgi:hypothetical protein